MNRYTADSSLPRREVLASAAGLAAAGLAGCLGGSDGSGYEPTEVSDPPEGTPGEFYYVLEERVAGYDITVDALYENDGDLILEYYSDAEAQVEALDDADDAEAIDAVEQHTMDEIGVITEAFNEVLVKHGSGAEYGMLVGDIVNPHEEQAHGWGLRSEWIEQYNDGEMDEVGLFMSISGTFVYEEDVAEES